ncbi:TPA: hypothetical protein JS563_000741 [Serratia marcescens]|nr:hypothetical protein [Serratia marcescens]
MGAKTVVKKWEQVGYTGEVYRFFDKEEYANALCNGDIRISTLDICRKYENAEQGDAGEGSWTQEIKNLVVDGGDPRNGALRYAGIYVHPSAVATSIGYARADISLADAYLICTTKKYDPTVFKESFGEYCVKISDAQRFAAIIGKAISELHDGMDITALYNDVTYLEKRTGMNYSVPNTHIGFIKPEHPYKEQNEFRFLWLPKDRNMKLKTLDLNCHELSCICSRVY